MMEARYFEFSKEGYIVCNLCPRCCVIKEGSNGFCEARGVRDGKLILLNAWKIGGFALDPVEKKPLYHFLPGSHLLSFGSFGCNLQCKFCQNWQTSRAQLGQREFYEMTASDIVREALREGAAGIAYTYNEPLIAAEFVEEVAQLSRQHGLKNVAVTAGYVNAEPRRNFFATMDGANVDLKGFSEEFYRRMTGVHLQPVLETLEYLVHETSVWIEITNLIIEGKNDDSELIEKMCAWIVSKLGSDIPLHFSAFHPAYQLTSPARTSLQTLQKARMIAISHGIKYVYIGNISDLDGSTTYCFSCKKPVITRAGFNGTSTLLIAKNRCPHCNSEVAGVMSAE